MLIEGAEKYKLNLAVTAAFSYITLFLLKGIKMP